MRESEIRQLLGRLLQRLPDRQIENVKGRGVTTHHANMHHNIPRFAFQLKTLLDELPNKGRIVDVGGGINPFGMAAIELGFEYDLLDDFSDRWHGEVNEFLQLESQHGVNIVSMDILADPFPFGPETVDAVVSFDVLEHLHATPRPLLEAMTASLKPGGVMFLGLPNCVNLRKRITVPFGKGKWSTFEEWYGEDQFRGHVREPDVDDLRSIATSLGFSNYRIIGRNWYAYADRFKAISPVIPVADRILRSLPSLCSNIYLLARKTDSPSH